MHTDLRPTSEQLEVLARIPSGEAVEASAVQADLSRPAVLAHLRNLEDQGLVRAVRQRPKVVEVAPDRFAATLHGLLRSRPHLRAVLHGSGLAVLAGVATSAPAATVREVSGSTGLHRNTVQQRVRELRRRALVQRTPEGYRIAEHVPELRHLGEAFRDHLVEALLAEHRAAYPVRADGLRVLLEADRPVEGLEETAAFRFQHEGADVLAARPQYVFTPGHAPVDLADAYRDAVRLATPPRTLQAMERFMEERGVRVVED